MAVYYMNSYDIYNVDEYQKYGPLAVALINRFGGDVIAADTAGIAIEGEARSMNAIIRFPNEESALACYNDPEYQEVKKIRLGSTGNCSIILVRELSKIESHR